MKAIILKLVLSIMICKQCHVESKSDVYKASILILLSKDFVVSATKSTITSAILEMSAISVIMSAIAPFL